jgi:large subunit ribosomal protein L31
MNKDIQPKYNKDATFKCACGAEFKIGSTHDSIETEICSKCHPFYTGQERRTGEMGRVQKFKERLSKQSK